MKAHYIVVLLLNLVMMKTLRIKGIAHILFTHFFGKSFEPYRIRALNSQTS